MFKSIKQTNLFQTAKKKISKLFFRKSKTTIRKIKTGEIQAKEKRKEKSWRSSGGAKYTKVLANGCLFRFENGEESKMSYSFGYVLQHRGAGWIKKRIMIK